MNPQEIDMSYEACCLRAPTPVTTDFPAPPDPLFPPGHVLTLSTELEHPSPIYFGQRIEHRFLPYLTRHAFDKLFFCAEEHVFRLHGQRLYDEARRHFPCHVQFLPPGERCKSFDVLADLCESFVGGNVSKKSVVIALGGGVVGNLVGLAAGLTFRGVRYVEVPTTMTAQTDSTLSNKQAINGRQGKNHFGLYHSPLFIWSDTAYLRTEPAGSKRCGIVEGIKNGFIADAAFLDYLEEELNPALEYSGPQLSELAYRIIQSKLTILRRDPSEKRESIILEYGHTFGHALEWLAKGKLSHGAAVAIGMKLAARLGHELGLISRDLVERHDYLIDARLGMSAAVPASITTDALLDAMIHDNKKTSKDLRFVLLEGAGRCHNPEGDFLVTVDPGLVRRVLNTFLATQGG
jgi:3-dehydroquinate synthetase